MTTEKAYRDLNNDGQMNPYEDATLPVEDRIDDLLGRMTIEEKAGLMFHDIVMIEDDGVFDPDKSAFGRSTIRKLIDKGMRDFFLIGATSAEKLAEWSNALQKLAEESRLGIPVTLASDPLHCVYSAPTINRKSPAFSSWPEMTGFGAIDDPELMRQFADIARQEYLATGIRLAIHPVGDLATEPRWARVGATFGEDAHVAARLMTPYIEGFQGDELNASSVACCTKHFPGGGAQQDGEDPHFNYGREQIYPAGKFDYHLIPFEAAFEANTASIMPYYGMPMGTDYEEVGFNFNKGIITTLLREKYGFDGLVLTDFGILTDSSPGGKHSPARAWGVEHLNLHDRIKKALDAGVDQFGGESCAEAVVEMVQNGDLTEARVDDAIRRVLRLKFQLGLFDNPYVDPVVAKHVVGNPAFRSAGELAQRKSVVMLKNGEQETVLPLQGRPAIYIEGIDPDVAGDYGNVVDDLADADLAILRLKTPYEPRETIMIESMMHAGDLDFKEPELSRILSILNTKPTIVDIHLERGAVIPEIASACVGLFATFGVSDTAILDVVFGRFNPSATLPFEMPSSMDAVRKQNPDAPHDSENPLFAYGFGLTY